MPTDARGKEPLAPARTARTAALATGAAGGEQPQFVPVPAEVPAGNNGGWDSWEEGPQGERGGWVGS